jgi:hypothetical protein
MPRWPYWWDWELEFTAYTLRRMRQRAVFETTIRIMLDSAERLTASATPGRWVAHCAHESEPWRVILEPDTSRQRAVVVTVYTVTPLE